MPLVILTILALGLVCVTAALVLDSTSGGSDEH